MQCECAPQRELAMALAVALAQIFAGTQVADRCGRLNKNTWVENALNFCNRESGNQQCHFLIHIPALLSNKFGPVLSIAQCSHLIGRERSRDPHYDEAILRSGFCPRN